MSKGITCIGLDLGRTMGIAVWNEDGLDFSETWEWKAKRGKLIPTERDEFRHALRDLIGNCSATVVAYERPHFRGYAATVSLCGWVCSVEEVCCALNVPILSVHTATLKKWATGSGKASKEQMIVEARKFKPDLDKDDDDQADAIHVARWGFSQLSS